MAKLVFNGFSLGLFVPIGDELRAPLDSLRIADNVYGIKTGRKEFKLRGRRGWQQYGSTVFGTRVHSVHRLYASATPSTLVAYENTSKVNFLKASGDSTTFSAPTGNFNAETGKPWRFASLPNQAYSFGVNGVDGVYSFDGTTLASVSITGVAVDGPYICTHKGRIYATKADELKANVYASNVGDITTNTGLNTIFVADGEGGLITGLASYFDTLLIPKTTCLFGFIGDPALPTEGMTIRLLEKGNQAPNALITCQYGIIMLSTNGPILTRGNANEYIDLGAPIRGLFVTRTGQNEYPDARGIWFPRQQQYWLQLSDEDAHIYICQFFGRATEYAWYRYPNLGMTAACCFTNEQDDGKLLAGDFDGLLREYDYGDTDNGSSFTSTVRSWSMPVDAESWKEGRVYDGYVTARYTKPMSLAVTYDDDDSKTETVDILDNNKTAIQTVQVPFVDTSQIGQAVDFTIQSESGPELDVHTVQLYADVYEF